MCWCFCPGRGRYAACRPRLRARSLARRCGCGHSLASSPARQQDAALAPAAPVQRKVVLATNIAETSLTIPGVRVVVDSGLVRRARFDPATGMSRLETQRISRASAEQRQGRAGRKAPGVCYRGLERGRAAQLSRPSRRRRFSRPILRRWRWSSPLGRARRRGAALA